MSDILIAAIITTVITVSIIGGILFSKSRKQKPAVKTSILLTFLIGIPIFYFAFYILRVPLDQLLTSFLSIDSKIYLALTTLYAPFTEELAKLLIILLAFLTKKISKKNYHLFAFAAGLGFGIGEICFISNSLTQLPQLAGLPWYMFSGFLIERFLVSFIHGAFLLISLHYLFKKQYRGILYAMLLHWFLNIWIFIGFITGLHQSVPWQVFVSQLVPLFAIAMMVITIKITNNGKTTIKGHYARCPECKKVYERPFFGIAMLLKKYEKCGNCQKWHWIGFKNHHRKK